MVSTSTSISYSMEMQQEMESKSREEVLLLHGKKALKRYEEGSGDSDEYDSEEEAMTLMKMKDEELDRYEELRDVHINQLVQYGRIMPVDQEIRRHMFDWLPGIPEERASKAVKKARTKGKEKLTVQTTPKMKEDDVLVIKVIPGIGMTTTDPVVKTEVEEDPIETMQEEGETLGHQIDIEPEEGEEESADLTIHDLIPKAVNKTAVINALEKLAAGAKQQAAAYEVLSHEIAKNSDEEVIKIVSTLPTPVTVPLSDPVRNTIESTDMESINYALAMGMYHLEQHLYQKAKFHGQDYPKPTQTEMCKRFNLKDRKFSELYRGTYYPGGSAKVE